MNEFWAGIWRSGARATGMGLILCAVIASVLYAFNWHTFYDTRGNLAAREAERVAADVAGMWLAIGSESGFRSELRSELDAAETLLGEMETRRGELDAWVAAPGTAEVDFSEHSRAGKVETAFARIDRSFVDRYFSHVGFVLALLLRAHCRDFRRFSIRVR